MQRAGPPPGSFPLLAERLPIPFQCSPYGFPILRRRLQDYFFGLLLDEPRSQRSQLFRVTAKHPSLKLVFAFDFNVGHNYSQHLLVDIDSRYPVRHRLLLAGSGERAAITLTRVAGYRRSPGEDNDAQLFAQDRKSTRLNSSHGYISYAVFCLKKKKQHMQYTQLETASNAHTPLDVHSA